MNYLNTRVPDRCQINEIVPMKNETILFKMIAIYFDGTLCYSKWPKLDQLNTALISHLQEWKRNGNKLILRTCCAREALPKAAE